MQSCSLECCGPCVQSGNQNTQPRRREVWTAWIAGGFFSGYVFKRLDVCTARDHALRLADSRLPVTRVDVRCRLVLCRKSDKASNYRRRRWTLGDRVPPAAAACVE